MNFARDLNLSAGARELHRALVFESPARAKALLEDLARELKGAGAKPVAIEVFAPKKYAGFVSEFLEDLSAQGCPLNHVLPLDENSPIELAGAHITAVSGAGAEYKIQNGIKTSVFEAGGEKYCRIFGATVPVNGRPLNVYTEGVINDMRLALEKNGFKFSDTARTWFYNFDILGWYSDFNRGRTKFFRDNSVFDGLLPASTGIGAPNPAGTRIQCGLIAVKDAPARKKIREIPSPLQGGATEYGSSFSRAVELDFDSYRRVMVSGTASISPDGKTLYFGDISKQVELTMSVIEGILKSRNMDFSDTLRSVVYCMKPEFYKTFLDWQKSRGLNLPHVPSYSTVCRADLMFEVELDAFKNK
ncbi:MAG: hypothetical protein J6P03_03525 [Opitutales bacterium]|nr:hypothetical protein [Opitutales bacterium]